MCVKITLLFSLKYLQNYFRALVYSIFFPQHAFYITVNRQIKRKTGLKTNQIGVYTALV